MPLIQHCGSCLRAVRLQQSAFPSLGITVRFKSTERVQPEPIAIDEEEHDFEDVLGELHRRRKKMDMKRNRTVSSSSREQADDRVETLSTFSG